ncbi:DUF874 family protein, partial [Helicobacter pylori]|uniref:DUF874 family protein n=1 Tax=Helicobacter pylori TaxID=210 RepID=UPI000D4BC81F
EKENQINWWKYSGLTIATSLLLAACSTGDVSEQIELEQEKQKTSNIETNNQIKVEQEKQKTSNIETNNQIKVEQEQQKTINTQRDLIKEQKDFIKYAEQNCQEKHNQFFIKKAG